MVITKEYIEAANTIAPSGYKYFVQLITGQSYYYHSLIDIIEDMGNLVRITGLTIFDKSNGYTLGEISHIDNKSMLIH